MTNISPQHSLEILRKMCGAVGVDYDTFDFSKPNWFWDHTWTKEQEGEFITWLGAFLVKHKYVGKGTKRGQNWGEYEANKMMANYGWRVEE